jgi:hypothetical protein
MTISDVSVRWMGHLFAISSSAQNGNNTRKADILRRRGSRTENHDWGRINELGPVMFADAKNIRTEPGPELNLFQQILHMLDMAHAGGRGFESRRSLFPSRRFNMMNEPVTSRALGWRTLSAWAEAVVLC